MGFYWGDFRGYIGVILGVLLEFYWSGFSAILGYIGVFLGLYCGYIGFYIDLTVLQVAGLQGLRS